MGEMKMKGIFLSFIDKAEGGFCFINLPTLFDYFF